MLFFFFSRRRGHRRLKCDWSSDVCSSDLSDRIAASRVLELDRTMRLSDPIYVAGSPVIAGLRRETGKSAVLSTLYSDSVVGVCRELAPDGPPDLFDRGQRRPLVAGASAKAILAYLPPHQLRRIFVKHA